MSIETAVRDLKAQPRFSQNVAAWRTIPARAALYAPLPSGLDPRLTAALVRRGVEGLYTHQAAAVAAALRGEQVAVVTPAASGKTLCYNLPVLHWLMATPGARALYLYPTKALAHDQVAALEELIAISNSTVTAGSYDGDTPSGQRSRVRDKAQVVLSNPDMLHAGILPQHTRWAAFFANLRVVVIDEMHVYRGVFGSHVANVLRRLQRICRFYGSDPQFVMASATIANPGELAERLIERPVTVVGPELNGAPGGEKQIVFYNPPLVDAALGIRRSTASEAAELAARFLAGEVQTIVFAGSRLSTELILLELREHGATGIRGYRGGYLPRERGEIERGLREGKIQGVVATNALELGIDIGQLDAVVLSGYPGTIASARQQIGRAGRRQGASIAVLVASPGALDQFVLAHPDYLLGSSPERALLNPDNPIILTQQLACAAAELPFGPHEGFGKAPDVDALLAYLVADRTLYASGGRTYWGGEGFPAAEISLRTGSPDRVMIQSDSGTGPAVIGEIERGSVPLLVYPGAVYIHDGDSYLVERLDWEAGIASVRRADVDFYTRPSINEQVEVLTEREARAWRAGAHQADAEALPVGEGPGEQFSAYRAAWGDVRVVSKASGYRIQKRGSHEVLGFGTVDLPEQVLDTTASWLELSQVLIDDLKGTGDWLSDPNEYGSNWAAQRAAARMRDGYCCQACGLPERDGKQHDIHHKVPFRAFVADARLRPGLLPEEAWRAANQLENLVTLCSACHHRAEAGIRTRSGLGGLAALLAAVTPLYLMCDPRDLGIVVEPQAPGSRLPTITCYEKVAGGIGYAEEMFRLAPALLAASYELLTTCPCQRGCPACVGPVLEHEYTLDTKELTAALLGRMCLPNDSGML